jgi:hypothetical protein
MHVHIAVKPVLARTYGARFIGEIPDACDSTGSKKSADGSGFPSVRACIDHRASLAAYF